MSKYGDVIRQARQSENQQTTEPAPEADTKTNTKPSTKTAAEADTVGNSTAATSNPPENQKTSDTASKGQTTRKPENWQARE